MTDGPPKKPRGRPRIDPAEKKANDSARAVAHRKAKRADMVEKTAWITPQANDLLTLIIAARPTKTTFSDLVEAWITKEAGDES